MKLIAKLFIQFFLSRAVFRFLLLIAEIVLSLLVRRSGNSYGDMNSGIDTNDDIAALRQEKQQSGARIRVETYIIIANQSNLHCIRSTHRMQQC